MRYDNVLPLDYSLDVTVIQGETKYGYDFLSTMLPTSESASLQAYIIGICDM